MVINDDCDVQSIASMGRVAEFFFERVTTWQSLLSGVEATLRQWLHVQRRWLALVGAGADADRNVVVTVCRWWATASGSLSD